MIKINSNDGRSWSFADNAAYLAWLETPEGVAWSAVWDAGSAWMAEAERATRGAGSWDHRFQVRGVRDRRRF